MSLSVIISRVMLFGLVFAGALLSTREADAAPQRRKPKPPAAPSVTLRVNRPDLVELSATYVPGFRLEHQLISGPNTAGSPSSLTIGPFFRVGDLDYIRNTYPVLLQPNTEYVVRVRQIKTSAEFSAWTSFTFRTAPQFLSRPSSPRNLRVTRRTATQVTLEWDAPNTTAGFTYEYFINGVKTPLTRCRGPYVFCTEADFRIVTFDLPAAGTSLRFGVAARDVDLNLSLPAELDIAN